MSENIAINSLSKDDLKKYIIKLEEKSIGPSNYGGGYTLVESNLLRICLI